MDNMSIKGDNDSIEAEIERELQALAEETDQLTDDLSSELDDVQEDGTGSSNNDAELLPSMLDYISKVQSQSQKLEEELRECEDVLHETSIASARKNDGADQLLFELASEQGLDTETFKQKVLEELEREDEETEKLIAEYNFDDPAEQQSPENNNVQMEDNPSVDHLFSTEVVADDRIYDNDSKKDPIDSQAVQIVKNCDSFVQPMKESTEVSLQAPANDETEDSDKNGKEKLALAQGVIAEVSQFDLLERQALKQLKELAENYRKKEQIWKEEGDQIKYEAEMKSIKEENIRRQKREELELEHKVLDQKREVQEKNFEAEMQKSQKKNDEELREYEAKINKFAEQAEHEKEEFKKTLEEISRREEQAKHNAATKIQARYRGHMVRLEYGEAVTTRKEESKLLKEQSRIREIETQRLKQQELERKKQDEENRKKQKEEEERILKEEAKREAKELEKKQREDERKRKLEEERKKKEDAERKEEEDRKLKEEEERFKKEREERKREEERKRKEEESRQKEELERRKREEELRKVQEERKRKEEEHRKREEEERLRLENEKRKQDEERKKKEEEEKRKKEEEERRKEEERTKHERHQKQIGKIPTVNGSLTSLYEDWGDTMPLSLEQKRLAWMKECKPWSKTLGDLKTKKAPSSRRPPRRPISAKKLAPLDEQTILTAANVVSLQQVTTVELNDLPGCSINTLGQCTSLKSLTMNNCNVIALDGLENCKTLHYIHLTHNKCEMVNVKELVTLVYLDLSHNSMSSIHGVDGCSSLKYLNMSNNRITRIGGLETLKKLHTLNLSSNQLITTRGLNESPTIQVLDLSNNHLPNVDDIDKLGLLQCLNVAGNNLLQPPFLANQVLLNKLVLSSNSISSLANVSTVWLPLLSHLDLTQNSICSVADLSSCLLLETLHIGNNQILEYEVLSASLSKCRHLSCLTLEGNPLIEEQGTRETIVARFVGLKELDGKATNTCPKEMHLTTYERMCKSQLAQVEKLEKSYQKMLKSARRKDHAQIHHKHFTKSYQLASEHRYAHEYGDLSVNLAQDVSASMDKDIVASVTPKKVPATPKSAILDRASQRVSPKPPSQATQMKNKFEEALQNAGNTSNEDKKGPVTHNTGQNCSLKSPSQSEVMKNKFEEAVCNSQTASRNSTSVSQTGDGSEKLPAVTASSIGRILKDEGVINYQKFENVCATRIQAAWRGHKVRRSYHKYRPQRGPPDGAPHSQNSQTEASPQTHGAATQIQAVWRGYILRKRLMLAMDFARLDDTDDDFPDMDIDLKAFTFNEDDLDKGWTPPETPQLPQNHPVIGQLNSQVQITPRPPDVPPLFERPHPPEQPRHAWRGQSPLYGGGKPPLPPVTPISVHSDMTEQLTHRTHLSKKGEKLSEEWGFTDARTAELMMARAKKLKYNAVNKKKFGKLDPKQRLALFRRLEETSKLGPVHPPARKKPVRKEYFKAREEEIVSKDREKRIEVHEKVNRTYEWVHTQVGGYDANSSRISESNLSRGNYNSENNLPRLENTGRRTNLMGSPVMDLQSIDSSSITGDMPQPRRLSIQDNVPDRLPPIKTSSAPTVRSGERLSWRGQEVKRSGGWGGGKKLRAKVNKI